MGINEAHQEILAGNKVINRNFKVLKYIHLVDGEIRDNEGSKIPNHFWNTLDPYWREGWKLVEINGNPAPPDKKEKEGKQPGSST